MNNDIFPVFLCILNLQMNNHQCQSIGFVYRLKFVLYVSVNLYLNNTALFVLCTLYITVILLYTVIGTTSLTLKFTRKSYRKIQKRYRL